MTDSPSSRGGKVTAAESPAKAKALKALHAKRRGVRIHPDTRERRTTIGELATLLNERHEPGKISIRAVAEFCRVSDRTVRRWLAEKHFPSPPKVRRMQQFLERNKK